MQIICELRGTDLQREEETSLVAVLTARHLP